MNSFWLSKFDRVLIDEKVLSSETALRFMEIFGERVEIITGEPTDLYKGPLSAKQFSKSKKQVYLTEFKGQFFKKCPGFHKGLACCNYFVLNLGFQCDMDCSYCYLQSFVNSNYTAVYTNIGDALKELESMDHLRGQPVRVGTGEVVDSLSIDPITLYSRELIDFFKNYPEWQLEFKTKSAFVDQFLDCEHGGNIIVSWSINPPYIIKNEEHATASFADRIQAALKCAQKNYQISFHIDPMIWHLEWKDNYAFLVDQITKNFNPHIIPYISVGALRFQPEQKNIMRERFGMESLVNQAETFKSKDGKLRYDYGLRREMFDFVLNRFKQNDPSWKLFMCMEAPETWVDTFGHTPHKEQPLKELFQPIR